MTDQPPKIVPFGKYKGRSIEEVLADDPAYLEWLSGQDWFRTKFAVLYQVIINRGGEPQDTPEHNALQVKFLDDEFCMRFLRHTIPNYETQALDRLNKARTANLQFVKRKIESEMKAADEAESRLADDIKRINRTDTYYHARPVERDKALAEARENCNRKIRKHNERCTHLYRLHTLLSSTITKVEFDVKREFEVGGVDVVLRIRTDIEWRLGVEQDRTGEAVDSYWRWHWEQWRDSAHWDAAFEIELKPTIGDDYPAVLRQMKANDSDVLLLRDYVGTGATREQFIATFATAGKRVVFLHDVEGG